MLNITHMNYIYGSFLTLIEMMTLHLTLPEKITKKILVTVTMFLKIFKSQAVQENGINSTHVCNIRDNYYY